MKRIILCFDGTWNAVTDPKTVTNVVRLANLLTVSSEDGTDQIAYYNSGVGSGGPLDRFLGGAFGVGLKSNVKRGLAYLALNYDQGDEIYLFGFSRGAYTARALGGVVGVAGIPLDISESERHWDFYRQIAQLRDKQRKLKRSSTKYDAIEQQIIAVTKDLNKVSRYKGGEVPIRCVGVWDTVGAYGIPAGMGLSALPHLFTYWTRGFRDTQIGKSVLLGLHAMAIDERRRPFVPTFWTLRHGTELVKAQEVEQMWFAGVHSNIGGGYSNCGLSDLALAWMVARVAERTNLQFNHDELLKTVWPCSACMLYRSSRGGPLRGVLPSVTASAVARFWHAFLRLFGVKQREPRTRVNEKVHWSVEERRRWPATLVDGLGAQKYAPRNLGNTVKEISEPMALERELIAGHRDWKGHCPLLNAGLPSCQCATLRPRIAQPQQQPQAAA